MDKKDFLGILGDLQNLVFEALGLFYENAWFIVGTLISLILICLISFAINKLIVSFFEILIKVLLGFVCLSCFIIAVACFVNKSIWGGVGWAVASLLLFLYLLACVGSSDSIKKSSDKSTTP